MEPGGVLDSFPSSEEKDTPYQPKSLGAAVVYCKKVTVGERKNELTTSP
jgi:hypothetical protein